MLIHLYSSYTEVNTGPKGSKATSVRGYRDVPMTNGHVLASQSAADRQARELQEFELEALMSDDEDDNETNRKPNGRP